MSDENQNLDEVMSIRFFEAIKSENIPEIVKFFRNEKIKAWQFREEDEYTGKIILILALHRATFMNSSLIVSAMLDELRIRLGIEARKEIKKWVNEKSEQGHTAIHYAAYRGNIEIINKLIENGAEVEISNNRGLNVLHMASQGNQPGALVYFKEKYLMNISSVDDLGSTPLHWACYTGSDLSVLYLLSWNTNVNAQDREGLTPLHLAVMSERTHILKKLLQKGADKNITDHKNRTPFDLAVTKNKLSIVDMLKEKPDCQLCVFKAPIHKIEKNNFNIYFFFIIHLVAELLVFWALLPYLNSKLISILYILTFLILILFYVVLIFSDPGILRRDNSKPLIRLVEEKVNICDYCPQCQVQMTYRSKHCIICDRCVDNFDHHCYWVNNCIGKENMFYFQVFIVIANFNILLNLVLSSYSLSVKDLPDKDEAFPPMLWNWLYKDATKIVIATLIILTSLIFAVPVTYLVYNQIKINFFRKPKKEHKTKSMSRAGKNSIVEISDKSSFLLQNLKTDEENVLIVEKNKKK